MILGRGYVFLGNSGEGVMEYSQRKKEGLLETWTSLRNQ